MAPSLMGKRILQILMMLMGIPRIQIQRMTARMIHRLSVPGVPCGGDGRENRQCPKKSAGSTT